MFVYTLYVLKKQAAIFTASIVSSCFILLMYTIFASPAVSQEVQGTRTNLTPNHSGASSGGDPQASSSSSTQGHNAEAATAVATAESAVTTQKTKVTWGTKQ